jgi:hypothetical protein
VGTDWNWGMDKKVSMTEDQAKMLVNQIVEAVTQARQSDLLEHFQKFAQVQIELGQARNDLQRAVEDARKEIELRDREIAALRLHIERLMNMLNPSNVQFSPYNNNGSAPVSSIPATFPVPMPPAPAAYHTYGVVPDSSAS